MRALPRRCGQRFLLLVPICCCFAYFYFISVHRVHDLEDVQAIVKTLQQPHVDERCRRVNDSHVQCLPNVLFIGASKCGTTSLVQHLSQHPHVKFVNRRIHNDDKHREVHRFDRNTFPWALSAVDLADEWASSPIVPSPSTTVIHYTPHYFYAPTVPFTVRSFYPSATAASSGSGRNGLRFLVMLRNPVQRAWSSYWFHNSHLLLGEDRGSVQEFMHLARKEMSSRIDFERCMTAALLEESERESNSPLKNSSVLLNNPHLHYMSRLLDCQQLCALRQDSVIKSVDAMSHQCSCNVLHSNSAEGAITRESRRIKLQAALSRCFGKDLHGAGLGHRHIDKGIYIDQLLRWLANFDVEQFLFLTLEEFHSQPKDSFRRVLDFMGTTAAIEAAGDNQDSLLNTINFDSKRLEKPNSRSQEQQLSTEERQELDAFFAPYNQLLSSILSRQLPFQLQTPR